MDPIEVPLYDAFVEKFGTARKNERKGYSIGYSDGQAGPQWNAGWDTDSIGSRLTRYVGVNLEGLVYPKHKGRPILKLLDREIADPQLFDAISRIPRPDQEHIKVYLLREERGGNNGRFVVHTGTKVILAGESLVKLAEEPERWVAGLKKAKSYVHLDPDDPNHHTIPHLYFRYELLSEWVSKTDWSKDLTAVQEKMKPLHAFVANRIR